MMRALRLNIKQAFCNRVSLIIMFSGLALISIYHYYYVIRYIGDGTDVFVTTAFKWIGFRDNEMDVYLLLMPVIASLPFSTSYNSDKSDDFKPFISKRISLFPYSVTKYIVTFFCGGILYTFPFILSLLFCILTIPNGAPAFGTGIINDNGMFANLYYDSPLTYIIVYIGINFLFAGLMALLGLAASVWSQKDYMAILFPFAVTSIPYVLLNTIFPTIGGAPIHLYDPKQPLQGMSPYILMLQCAFFLFVSLCMYIKGVQRDKKRYKRRLQRRDRCRKAFQAISD
ncbi:hypothetical protein CN931_12415 [Bacillus sp. AFS054943]|uniref:hypothetical protein n=1 Tax=Bacillus TaxID=1386 RepID=UPI000BF81B32|nr:MULTISPECIES: hypothetical protein [Bacillus]MDH4423622.1 hypothetical protein [Bacillus cereus]PER22065.1 hypothetical protein CN476_22015 [Bacillus cereus]PFA64075.1 hypothetical protein CN402_05795 [Bacillus sp. AFS015896]PGL84030.1 hypothetical protein CN931_12415 [Bacillus sp. AFS054943]PGX07829.1 hypothetical protein COE07_21645 [Bacillus sp. AFS033286]